MKDLLHANLTIFELQEEIQVKNAENSKLKAQISLLKKMSTVTGADMNSVFSEHKENVYVKKEAAD